MALDSKSTTLLVEVREQVAFASTVIDTLQRQAGKGKKQVAPNLVYAFRKLTGQQMGVAFWLRRSGYRYVGPLMSKMHLVPDTSARTVLI